MVQLCIHKHTYTGRCLAALDIFQVSSQKQTRIRSMFSCIRHVLITYSETYR